MPSCEYCSHAAFDQSGVYCTLFNEPILTPVAVAEECGEYDDVDTGVIQPGAVIHRFPGSISNEIDRVVNMEIEIPYLGKPEHGDRIAADFKRHLKLWYGDMKVTRTDG